MSYKTLEVPADPRTVCDALQYFLSSKCRDWQSGDRFCQLTRPYAKLRVPGTGHGRTHGASSSMQIELCAQEERRQDGGDWYITDRAVLLARLTIRPISPTDWLLDVWPSSSGWQAEAELIDRAVEALQRTRGRSPQKPKKGTPRFEESLDWSEIEQKARQFQRMVAKGKNEREAAELLGYSRETLRDWCDMTGLRLKKPHKKPKKF